MTPASASRSQRKVRFSETGSSADSYAGFISYSHSGDAPFARALQRGVERFAKRWNRLRAVRLFRDDTNLTASPGLWSSIEDALARSGWLVLLVSPEAATSYWVGREVEWWLAQRRGARVLLVLTGGELVWDNDLGDFDPELSTALPTAFAGAFTEEPLWVDARWSRTVEQHLPDDPRMHGVVVDVSAALRGLDRDSLVGEAVTEHRRTKRIVRAAWTTLAFLVALSLVAGALAWIQRGHALTQRQAAIRQANVAESRLLAALSQQQLSNDIGLSARLALAADSIDSNAQTRQSLFAVSLASPQLQAVTQVPTNVGTIAQSSARGVVAAALTDGTILRWAIGTRPQLLGKTKREATSLAMSSDGREVIASTGSEVTLFGTGGDVEVADAPEEVANVAIAPDGRRAWLTGGGYEHGKLWEVDVAHASAHPVAAPLGFDAWLAHVAVDGKGVVTVFDEGYGSWISMDSRRAYKRVAGAALGFGTYESVVGLSSNGDFMGVTTHDTGRAIQLYTRDDTGRDGVEVVDIGDRVNNPQTLAIAPDGMQVAVVSDGVIHVAPTAAGSEAGTLPDQLAGAGQPSDMAFVGDGTHLVSSAGNRLFAWDLQQVDRLASTQRVGLSTGCAGCGQPYVAISKDGDWLAAVNGSGSDGAVLNLKTGKEHDLADPELDFTYTAPLWVGDNLVVPVAANSGGTVATAPTQAPGIWSWFLGHEDEQPIDMAATQSGRVALIFHDGTMELRAPRTGAVEESIHLESTAPAIEISSAAFDSSGDEVAVVHKGRVQLNAASDGSLLTKVPGSHAQLVRFAGSKLLIQREDGTLEVRNHRGHLMRSLPGGSTNFWAPVGDPHSSLLARIHNDTSIGVVDSRTGENLGTLPATSNSSTNRVAAAFAPHDLLVTVTEDSADALVAVQDLSVKSLRESACSLERPVSSSEWAGVVGEGAPPEPRIGCG